MTERFSSESFELEIRSKVLPYLYYFLDAKGNEVGRHSAERVTPAELGAVLALRGISPNPDRIGAATEVCPRHSVRVSLGVQGQRRDVPQLSVPVISAGRDVSMMGSHGSTLVQQQLRDLKTHNPDALQESDVSSVREQ